MKKSFSRFAGSEVQNNGWTETSYADYSGIVDLYIGRRNFKLQTLKYTTAHSPSYWLLHGQQSADDVCSRRDADSLKITEVRLQMKTNSKKEVTYVKALQFIIDGEYEK